MSDLPPLRDVIARHGLGARKSLGQHFLLDLNVCSKIARSAERLDDGVIIEIGPGPGGLTRALLDEGAQRVIAVERDSRCLDALAEISEAFPGRLEVIEGDAMNIDLTAIGEAPRRIIANLPYNISVPLMMAWLKRADAFAEMVLMFQKEVADRINAKPRTKDYGRVSVMVQWCCEVRPLFNLSKDAFTPPPKVVSTVVSLRPRQGTTDGVTWNSLDRVTRAAFAKRRKMLRSNLKELNLPLEDLGVSPTARAEELTVDDFCRLAKAL